MPARKSPIPSEPLPQPQGEDDVARPSEGTRASAIDDSLVRAAHLIERFASPSDTRSGPRPSTGHQRSPATSPPPAGDPIAGRYWLHRPLGRGGHGEVWEADDLLTGERVAVKLLNASTAEPARVRREVAALRMLRVPGVVALLDEGMHEGRPFLVMARVEGTPFPGTATQGAWAPIADVTVALLETLARVHAAGVVHRDLKPANVLVGAEGRPTILDFGVSFGAAIGPGLTMEGQIVGTPAYLAPEQILAGPVSPRTDLYAIGVMLYEALAGRLPHTHSGLQNVLHARLTRRPAPLRELAPEVPAAAAAIVDSLLAFAPEDRPRSAADVISMLRGRPSAEAAEPTFRRLGGDRVVAALVDASRRRRAIDLVGEHGSGRSRSLSDAAAALEQDGRRLVWTAPGRRAYASLEALIGDLEEHSSKPLDDVTALIDDRVREALSRGCILVCDDTESLDDWSREALDRCRDAGCIIRALLPRPDESPRSRPADPSLGPVISDAVHLVPLAEAELRALFAGHDRIFHQRTDAARELWTRTQGLPARVVEELHAWVRAGIARVDVDAFSIDRDALDRLEAGLRLGNTALRAPVASRTSLSDPLEELLIWVSLAWPHSHVEFLASVTGDPEWRIEAGIRDLVRHGVARRRPDGRTEPLTAHRADEIWTPERRREAHRAIACALPPGFEGRLLHWLVAGGEGTDGTAAEIIDEALALSTRLAREGRLGQAIAALAESLLDLRRRTPPEGSNPTAAELRLLSLWVEIALADGTPRALDRVLYEICRASQKSDAISHLEALVRSALALGTDGERALSLVEAVPPFATPELELARQRLRVFSARRYSLEREEAVLSDVASWAASSGDPAAQVSLAGWLGRLRYRQSRFDEAADLHAIAARGETWTTARVTSTLDGASALMEAFRHEDAASLASTALRLAQQCRDPYYEARAEWLLRSIAYRTGAAASPDMELVDAVAAVGVADLEALLCVNEAAVAWRRASLDQAADLASRAARIWTGLGKDWAAMLARTLAVASGERASETEISALGHRAERCPVAGVGIQILALLRRSTPSALPRDLEILPLASAVPHGCWHLRMDVLSVNECLETLGHAIADP